MLRRTFLKGTALFPLGLNLPGCLWAHATKPETFILSDSEREILWLVLEHLLPDKSGRPGATSVQALEHLERVMLDPRIRTSKRRVLKKGIAWVAESAADLYSKPFVYLTVTEREAALRDLENYRGGARWIRYVLSYLLEALLGDPAHGVNPKQVGWKWLGHLPGYPLAKTFKLTKANGS